MDSPSHTALVESEILKENWVDVDSEIITETAFAGDAWIGQRTQSMLTKK
jgi:hypothetical protein